MSKLRKPRRKSHPVLVTLLLMLIQLGVMIYAYILFAGFSQILAFRWKIFALVLIVFIINRE